MLPQEFEKLTHFEHNFDPSLIQNRADRTLLYGYDFERNTIHLFMYKGEVHFLRYTHEVETIIDGIRFISNYMKHIHIDKPIPYYDIIPSKRLYPESCDFETCNLIITAGESLSFTKFDLDRMSMSSNKKFQGCLPSCLKP